MWLQSWSRPELLVLTLPPQLLVVLGWRCAVQRAALAAAGAAQQVVMVLLLPVVVKAAADWMAVCCHPELL